MRWSRGRGATLVAGAAGMAVMVLGLAGCGGGAATDNGSGAKKNIPMPTEQKDATLAAKVPAAIAQAGTVNIGVDATYAPNEFLAANGKDVQGWSPELLTIVLQKLGLKPHFVVSNFDDIIPGIQSGKYQMGASSFTVTADREKSLTMVSYFSAGEWWLVKKGNPEKINPDDVCGKRIAVQTGTTEETELNDKTKKCAAAGKAAIKLDSFKDQGLATQAVVTGKDQGMLADSPVTAYAIKQTGGSVQSLGQIYASAPYGYALPQAQQPFAQALQASLNAVMADGNYKKVLDRWGVGVGAIKSSAVNPPASS